MIAVACDKDVQRFQRLLKNIFRNSAVQGLATHGYYADACDRSQVNSLKLGIYLDLLAWRDILGRSSDAELQVPPVGNPSGLRVNDVLINNNSARHHYCATQVAGVADGIPSCVVCEIGGGFGGFAYYLFKQSAKPISYVDFDLAKVLLVASYYLIKAFPEKRFLLYGESSPLDLSRSTIRSFDGVMMPSFAIQQLQPDGIDVGFKTGSFSEMPLATITEYIRQLDEGGMRWFVHHNSDQPVLNCDGHVEVPASAFPVPPGFDSSRRLVRFGPGRPIASKNMSIFAVHGEG